MARKVVAGLTAAVVVLAGLVLQGSRAGASCAGLPDVERSLESSDLVFVGSVTDLVNVNRWATFRVETVWKGDPGSDRIEVRSGPASAAVATSNDRTYTTGERYLVFALDLARRPGARIGFGDGARWVDDACSATQPYESSLERFRPRRSGAESNNASGGSVRNTVVVAVVMLAGAMAVVMLVRGRRRVVG